MSDCSFCQYRLKEDDNTNQTCSKWVNNDDQDIPCKPSGKEIGDSPNDSSDNCSKVECPSHCQYPYPKEIYNSDAANSDLYGTNSYPLLKEIKDDPDRFNKFISDTTNDTYLKVFESNLTNTSSKLMPEDKSQLKSNLSTIIRHLNKNK